MKRGWISFFVALASVSSAMAAEDDEQRTLESAKNAFEYRDFGRVRELLWGWVHPPRMTGEARMFQARELLGISLHVEGKVAEAKDEFAQMLLARPDYKLDPFLVPPQVIEAFEETRRSMSAVLKRKEAPEPSIQLAIPSWMPWFIPFGLTQILVLDQPAWGGLWMALQVGGLAANIGGFWAASSLVDRGIVASDDAERFEQYRLTQVIGMVVFAVALVGSGVQGQVEMGNRDALQETASLGARGPFGFSMSF